MNKPIIHNIGSKPKDAPACAPCAFEPEEFRNDLADLQLTDEQEIEILEILWNMMGFFARTGFEVDVCGLIFDEFNEVSASTAGNGTMPPSTNMESASKPDGGSA